MNKAVLLSIQPKWCELIASGKKTLEVRKTKPNLKTPFKCYIYCTKGTNLQFWKGKRYSYADDHSHNAFDKCGNGKVIGEFICDTYIVDKTFGHDPLFNISACMSEIDAAVYSCQSPTYGWHISNLVIYDKPKALSEFFVMDRKAVNECSLRERIYTNPDFTNGAYLPGTYFCTKTNDYCRGACWKKSLSHPPQSWCYVEGA